MIRRDCMPKRSLAVGILSMDKTKKREDERHRVVTRLYSRLVYLVIIFILGYESPFDVFGGLRLHFVP